MDEQSIIGIIGAGFQGKAAAYWFARNGFRVVMYDANPDQISKVNAELGGAKKRSIQSFIRITGEIRDLDECHLIIENIPENLEMKMALFAKVEEVAAPGAILASNSSAFPASCIFRNLSRKERCINIHFLGVNWGSKLVEVIPSAETSDQTLRSSLDVLTRAGFKAIGVGECPGFVFNRLKGLELANIIRAYEMGLVDYDSMLKYLLYPIKGNWNVGFIDLLGIEISESIIRFMHRELGERYYISDLLTEKVRKNEFGVKTGKGFLDYTGVKDPFTLLNSRNEQLLPSRFRKIYMDNLLLNQTNFLLRLINSGKEVYFPHRNSPYLEALRRTDEKLALKVLGKIKFADENPQENGYDMIIVSEILPQEHLVQRLNTITALHGDRIPMIVFTPVYRISDLAKASQHQRAYLFGANVQKSYLSNTELVRTHEEGNEIYGDVLGFLKEIAGDCIEVEDGYARPLMFLLIAKMFEAIRMVEEGVADVDTIEILLDRDVIFKDIDYFGLRELKIMADYLSAVYGEPFYAPVSLERMLQNGKTGAAEGEGFHVYFNPILTQ